MVDDNQMEGKYFIQLFNKYPFSLVMHSQLWVIVINHNHLQFAIHGEKIGSDQNFLSIYTKIQSNIQGDKGYCYIPYDYIANADYCFDPWTVKKVAGDDFGQDHWDQDDSVDYRQSGNNDDDGDGPSIEDFDNDDDDSDNGGNYHRIFIHFD